MRRDRGFQTLLQVPESLEHGLADQRQSRQQLLGPLLDLLVNRTGTETGKVMSQAPLRRGDAVVVVIQDNQELPIQRARLVEPFKSQAVDDARVAHQRDDPVAAAEELIGASQTQSRRDGRARVPDIEQVERALVDARKTADTARLPQGVESRITAGEQLVRITLVPDVPQQPVLLEVKAIVQGDRDLGDAQVAGQVPAVLADHLQDSLADLSGQLAELGDREFLDV